MHQPPYEDIEDQFEPAFRQWLDYLVRSEGQDKSFALARLRRLAEVDRLTVLEIFKGGFIAGSIWGARQQAKGTTVAAGTKTC